MQPNLILNWRVSVFRSVFQFLSFLCLVNRRSAAQVLMLVKIHLDREKLVYRPTCCGRGCRVAQKFWELSSGLFCCFLYLGKPRPPPPETPKQLLTKNNSLVYMSGSYLEWSQEFFFVFLSWGMVGFFPSLSCFRMGFLFHQPAISVVFESSNREAVTVRERIPYPSDVTSAKSPESVKCYCRPNFSHLPFFWKKKIRLFASWNEIRSVEFCWENFHCCGKQLNKKHQMNFNPHTWSYVQSAFLFWNFQEKEDRQ